MIAHCLFEQSGTFKNEFKKLGYEAYDYDILNDFGETDYQVDLFAEIEGGYNGEPSIFDNIRSHEDIILAFFPCTRFEEQILLGFRGEMFQQKNYSDEEKLVYSMKLHEDLHRNYLLISKLVIICLQHNFRLVIENPYGEQHYLKRYWCMKPSLIDRDRRQNGDYYKKPTQYYFVGFKPFNNFIFEPMEMVEQMNIKRQTSKNGQSRTVRRSIIHPQYASRFIRQYLIDLDAKEA